jgi:hypothetical protein
MAALTSVPSAASLVVASMALASLLLGSVLLAGCGGDAKPDASSSSTSAPSPTTTAPPTASPTTDPNIPVAARAHTPAGAEAFVRYFYSQVNTAWTKPNAGLISALSSPGCKSCAALEATAAGLVEKHQHYDGAPVTIVTVAGLGESSPGRPEVLVVFIQEHRSVIDETGQVVLTDKRKQGKSVATLGWSGHGWLVAMVQSLA